MQIRISKKLILYLILVFALSLILIQPILKFAFFPSEINLIAGTEHKFQFNIPAVATIHNTESTNININNEKVESIKNINLNEPFSVLSEKEGSLDMKLSVMGIPVRNVKLSVHPSIKLVPCGTAIGVRINTNGIMVLSVGSVKGEDKKNYEPCANLIKAGDLILSANGKNINNKEELIKEIETLKNTNVDLQINRNGKILNQNISVVKGSDGLNKIGLWVRDSTQGIGTMTYYNPDTLEFGSLGHGIVDVDTKELMSVKDGKIMSSNIAAINKGEKGCPGELIGDIKTDKTIGSIRTNTNFGVYGKLDADNFKINPLNAIPIAMNSEITEGSAYILSNIEGNQVKKYNIMIESVNHFNTDTSKGMVIKITDDELLKKTNGIVQGMSGSPIIQNGKLIGAVTHVFVQEPEKGYGIFIENMIKN